MKIKLKGAQKGHSLLKRKSDALTSRFRQILQRIREAKLLMGKTMRQAAFALAEVNFAAGDISYAVRERVTSAQLKVRARLENVSGVQLPTFECATEGSAGSTLPTSSTSAAGPNSSSSPPPSTEGATQWLGRGGQQVQKCREAFIKALQSLVELAGLQTAFFVLDETIRITNRRVNALEYVVLPKVENTLAYIISELDEQDREDFFRLKKVQSNKKKHGEREQASRKAMENEGKADGDGSLLPFLGRLQISDRDATGREFDEGPRSILADLEDADVFI